jgi:hypothetical protein
VTANTSFDFVETCRAIAEAGTPEELARIVGSDPRKQRLAERIAADVAAAPPLTPEQRAGIRAVLLGARRGAADA